MVECQEKHSRLKNSESKFSVVKPNSGWDSLRKRSIRLLSFRIKQRFRDVGRFHQGVAESLAWPRLARRLHSRDPHAESFCCDRILFRIDYSNSMVNYHIVGIGRPEIETFSGHALILCPEPIFIGCA
jgi:hypothetical protein